MNDSYIQYDLTASAGRIQDILSGLPLNSNQFKTSAMSQYGESSATANTEGDALRTQSEREATSQYVSTTDTMAQMNESLNANVYIVMSLISELERVSALDKNAKKHIYKVRQEFMYIAYMTEFYKFMTNVVMYTLVVTLILLCFTSAWRMGNLQDILYYILCCVILSLYAVSMFILFKNAAHRRNYQWNKYYWKTTGDVKRAIQEYSRTVVGGDSCPA